MPHAALLVVQDDLQDIMILDDFSFNAARGFVGGARYPHTIFLLLLEGFNAARGFVGGARQNSIPSIR